MLGKLLELLQDGSTHSVQELSELLGDDVDGIMVKLGFLEAQGYIRRVSLIGDCHHHCIGCHGCDNVNPNLLMWEVVTQNGR